MVGDELYQRQEELDLEVPSSAVVIGVGGVGSWVALDLALAGVNNITIIDDDEIEENNLNRTPFKTSQIGSSKVNSVMELIFERRPNTNVQVFEKKIEELKETQLMNLNTRDVLIDCRDTDEPLPDSVTKDIDILGGYDGESITIHISPDLEKIWGDSEVRYEVTPSFLVPPQLIGALITYYLCKPEMEEEESISRTFELKELFEAIKRGDINE